MLPMQAVCQRHVDASLPQLIDVACWCSIVYMPWCMLMQSHRCIGALRLACCAWLLSARSWLAACWAWTRAEAFESSQTKLNAAKSKPTSVNGSSAMCSVDELSRASVDASIRREVAMLLLEVGNALSTCIGRASSSIC
jgi:hypothetical protein